MNHLPVVKLSGPLHGGPTDKHDFLHVMAALMLKNKDANSSSKTESEKLSTCFK